MTNLQSNKFLIVITGPTAVGKTDMAISLAKKLDTEIISADSRQFFRELEIGTAKPDKTQLKLVKHHFIAHLSIFDHYDAGQFAIDANSALRKIFKKSNVAILVGGSGLYIKALIEGLDDQPPSNTMLRESLNQLVEKKGLDLLLKELRELDPEYYHLVDQKNPKRVIRAIEVIRTSGKPYSAFRKGHVSPRKPFKVIKIGLNIQRKDLYERIDLRMEGMIATGLFDEAERLHPHAHLNALQTVGYSEVFGFLDDKYGQEEAIRLLKRNSRRYAKRQLTWFEKDSEIQWFEPDQIDKIFDHIQRCLNA